MRRLVEWIGVGVALLLMFHAEALTFPTLIWAPYLYVLTALAGIWWGETVS